MVTRVNFPFELAEKDFGEDAERVFSQLWTDPVYPQTDNYLELLQSLLVDPEVGQVFQGAQFSGTDLGLVIWDGERLLRTEEGQTVPFPVTAPDRIRVDTFVGEAETNWWHNTWYRQQTLNNLHWNAQERLSQTRVVISEPDFTPGVQVTFSFEPSLGLEEQQALEYFRSYLQSADYFLVAVDPNVDPQPGKIFRSISGLYRVCKDARNARGCEELHLFCPNEREKYFRDPMSRRDLENIATNMVYESYAFPEMFQIDWRSRVEQRVIRAGTKFDPMEFAASHGLGELVERLENSLRGHPELRESVRQAMQATLAADSIRSALE